MFIKPNRRKNLKVHKALDANIRLLKLFPGISKPILDSFLIQQIKRIVLETYGAEMQLQRLGL